MTLGQEFESFAAAMSDDQAGLKRIITRLGKVNLGGTAIGTGIAADPRYAEAARKHLAQITGYDIVTAPNLIEATSDVGVFLELSGALKRTALRLSKICNDLRLLASGPQAGLSEINLPPRQAGSSIMPGKVNPVIPEAMNQVAFVVAGGDATMSMAAEAGQLQLNAFEPVMAHVLFENLNWMTAAIEMLRVNCVENITANEEHLSSQVSSFVGVITALIPEIGYGSASRLAKEALASNANIADLIANSGLVAPEQVKVMLRPENLTSNRASNVSATRE